MQRRYTASDFSGSPYNVLDLGAVPVIKKWPYLKKYPEFNVNFAKLYRLPTDKVHKYALLLYTPNILSKSIPELVKRKAESALLAGFEYRLNTTFFQKQVEDMLMCLYPEINDLFVRTARITRNSQFEQLIVYEEARAKQMRKLLDDTGTEKTKDIHDNIRRLSEDIERLQADVLFQDNEKPLLERLYFSVENVQLGIRPEEIAEAKKHGNFDKLINITEIDYLSERLNVRDEQE